MENRDSKSDIIVEIRELLDKQTKDVKELLAKQTVVILNAVDEKIKALDLKFTEKFDKIMTLLDGLLGRIETLATEFTMMKEDINRIKRVIKEKLGVEL